jgi:hypothetical protein
MANFEAKPIISESEENTRLSRLFSAQCLRTNISYYVRSRYLILPMMANLVSSLSNPQEQSRRTQSATFSPSFNRRNHGHQEWEITAFRCPACKIVVITTLSHFNFCSLTLSLPRMVETTRLGDEAPLFLKRL